MSYNFRRIVKTISRLQVSVSDGVQGDFQYKIVTMILKICVLVLFSVAVIKSEDQDLDSLLDGIFTSPSTPVDGNTGVISGVLDGGLNVNTGLGQDGNGIGGQDGEPAKVSIL